jgi:thioredoxin 1
MSDMIEYVSDETFASDVSSIVEPILLDFTADWCAPCKAMDPVLEQVRKKYEGQLRILKVDLDESADICSQFGVFSIPTLIFLSSGEAKHRLAGARSYNQLVQEIDRFLQSTK